MKLDEASWYHDIIHITHLPSKSPLVALLMKDDFPTSRSPSTNTLKHDTIINVIHLHLNIQFYAAELNRANEF